MTSRDPGYTTDLLYPSNFIVSQAPLFLQWAAAAESAPRQLGSEPFNYCDLGCGDGLTLNVLATEYPAAHFVGVDINRNHLELGRKLAARAGLNNVSFVETSFRDLSKAGLPPMDFIAAHGIYSWIDEETRSALHAFVQSQLKPGGLFCLQYSCLPGTAIHDPLYHYLKAFADRVAGDSVQRFAAGRDVLQNLRQHAAFFQMLPQAGALMDTFSRNNPEQLAHDILNRNRHSLYSHQAHDVMASLGLRFTGSADLKLNHPELLMSRAAYAAFEEVTKHGDRRLRIATQDLMLNPSSRIDVFRKPDPELDAGPRPAGRRGIEGVWLKRTVGPDSIELRRRASANTAVDLASPLHSAVLDALGDRSALVPEVLQAAGLGQFDRAAVETAIAQLVMTRFINMLIAPTRELGYRADRRYRLASPINSILLDETIHSADAVAFASPVLGSALMIPVAVRLRMAAWLGRDLGVIWAQLRRFNRGYLDSRGRPVASLEQFRSEIETHVPTFVANSVPELLRLGLLEEDGPL